MLSIKAVPEASVAQTEASMEMDDPYFSALSMPEVLESIFQNLSKRELRQCRLVNSLWNEEVCRRFRQKCYVRLCDRNFLNFEKLIKNNGKLRLPNPFRLYKVSVRKLDDRNLSRILNWNPQAGILSCCLIVSQTSTNAYYQKRLVSILEKNNLCLDTLTFQMYRGIYLGYVAPEGDIPTLSSLRKVVINSKARGVRIPVESISFIISVINSAPKLKYLEINCDQEDVLLRISEQAKLQSLQSFYCESLTLRQLEALCTAKIPNLAKLHLKYNDTSLQDEYINPLKFHLLITTFASTLEELSMSWISHDNNYSFPLCPKLKSLTLYLYEGSMAAVNPLCFPALQNFSLVEYIEYQDATPIAHPEVQSFSMEDFSGIYLDEEFDMLLNFVEEQFPQLSKLKIHMVLNDTSIRTIVTTLPLLKEMHLRVGPLVTEEAFTGVPLGVNIDQHMENGADLKDLRMFPSLANMRYLAFLDVSNFPAGPQITDAAITHGMGTMPALECLIMNWDSSLSLQNIVNCLSHLKCLRVSDWHHIQPSGTLFQLKKLMPQLEIPGQGE